MAQAKKSKKTASKTGAAAKSKAKKANKPPVPVYSGPRRLKPADRAFPLNKWPFTRTVKEKPERVEHKPLPNVYLLFKHSLEILKKNWDLFLGIIFVYAVLNLLLVKGFASGADVSSIKSQFSGAFHGHIASAATGLSSFLSMLGGSSSSSTNPDSGAYQSILLIVASLVVVWTLRQVYAGMKPRIRDSFYKGITPLVPVLLIMCVIALQLIPFVIGAALFTALIDGGIALTVLEKVLSAAICLCLVSITFRWFCSSIFALYIATLPDMTPMKALRSARDLVNYRRFEVFRKILFLPIAVVVLGGVIMTPIIFFATPLTAASFFILTMVALAIVHSYLYTTYREML